MQIICSSKISSDKMTIYPVTENISESPTNLPETGLNAENV